MVLGLLILEVFLYMQNKSRIHGYSLRGLLLSLLVGVFRGMCSPFLGIGSAPINVALSIFLLSYPAKYGDGSFYGDGSLSLDFKIAVIALGTEFAGYALSIAPVMVVETIAGGFIDAGLNKRFSEKVVERAFNVVQLLVLAITVYNIVRNQ